MTTTTTTVPSTSERLRVIGDNTYDAIATWTAEKVITHDGVSHSLMCLGMVFDADTSMPAESDVEDIVVYGNDPMQFSDCIKFEKTGNDAKDEDDLVTITAFFRNTIPFNNEYE